MGEQHRAGQPSTGRLEESHLRTFYACHAYSCKCIPLAFYFCYLAGHWPDCSYCYANTFLGLFLSFWCQHRKPMLHLLSNCVVIYWVNIIELLHSVPLRATFGLFPFSFATINNAILPILVLKLLHREFPWINSLMWSHQIKILLEDWAQVSRWNMECPVFRISYLSQRSFLKGSWWFSLSQGLSSQGESVSPELASNPSTVRWCDEKQTLKTLSEFVFYSKTHL